MSMPYVPQSNCQRPQIHITPDMLTTVRNNRHACFIASTQARPSRYKQTQQVATVGYVGHMCRHLVISQMC